MGEHFGQAWLPSLRNMHRDLREFMPDMDRRDRFTTWATHYWSPTRRWMPKVSMWWAEHVQGYPPLPSIEKDRVARHFGFAEGVPPCTDGPTCAEHGWRLSSLVTGEAMSDE